MQQQSERAVPDSHVMNDTGSGGGGRSQAVSGDKNKYLNSRSLRKQWQVAAVNPLNGRYRDH